MSETPFDREQHEIDDARGFAAGGYVSGGQDAAVGEHACVHCGCHLPPQTVTVNVHGALPGVDDIVQRLVADLRKYRRFGS